MIWKTEEIPDNCFLFCNVHKGYLSKKDNSPNPSAFYNTPKTGDNLSTDWDKYSSAEESRERIGLQYKFGTTEFKNSSDFFIYAFETFKVRKIIPLQKVIHDPLQHLPPRLGIPNNRSHSIIIGDKGDKNDPEVRLKLVDAGEWAIAPK
ncbi:hypothetical protein [Aequorivita nionensis]|uniref:hypothetical protein n=1 Tax=Aequorivita nionensis TaxID=1287690 RepID=UPI003965C694